jgi:predicted component of type VI protein secretion system
MIERIDTLAKDAVAQRLREPGIAEFLDALRAVRELKPADKTEWEAITRLAMWKHPTKKGE